MILGFLKVHTSASPMALRCSPRATSQKGCLGVTTLRSSTVVPRPSRDVSTRLALQHPRHPRGMAAPHIPQGPVCRGRSSTPFWKSTSKNSSSKLLIGEMSLNAGLLLPCKHRPAPSCVEKAPCTDPRSDPTLLPKFLQNYAGGRVRQPRTPNTSAARKSLN